MRLDHLLSKEMKLVVDIRQRQVDSLDWCTVGSVVVFLKIELALNSYTRLVLSSLSF